jgi:hypothetical protein
LRKRIENFSALFWGDFILQLERKQEHQKPPWFDLDH